MSVGFCNNHSVTYLLFSCSSNAHNRPYSSTFFILPYYSANTVGASHTPISGSISKMHIVSMNSDINGIFRSPLYHDSTITCRSESHSTPSPTIAFTQIICEGRFEHSSGFRSHGKHVDKGTYSEHDHVIRSKGICSLGTLF